MNLLKNTPRKATMFDLSLKKKFCFFMLYNKGNIRGYRVISFFLLELSDSMAQYSHFLNARILFFFFLRFLCFSSKSHE